ncbi:hypothetical protein TNCV_3545771 [Trichonephila clavipes]|nr:hypothetical protein TNCV_3545771 [Trichonephila clavipes]
MSSLCVAGTIMDIPQLVKLFEPLISLNAALMLFLSNASVAFNSFLLDCGKQVLTGKRKPRKAHNFLPAENPFPDYP